MKPLQLLAFSSAASRSRWRAVLPLTERGQGRCCFSTTSSTRSPDGSSVPGQAGGRLPPARRDDSGRDPSSPGGHDLAGTAASLLATMDLGEAPSLFPSQPSARGASSYGGSHDSVLSRMGGSSSSRSSMLATPSSAVDFSKMRDPAGSLNDKALETTPIHYTEGPVPAVGPRLGKTIEIDLSKNRDVGKAFRMLNGLLTRENVRVDFRRQQFHERPGLKRKRLKSERHRRRFKVDFVRVVQRVQRLKNQGW